MLTGNLDNLLINGDFARELWGRAADAAEPVECEVWRETYDADRWLVRFPHAEGAGVGQAMSRDVPLLASCLTSLELRGAEGVTQPVRIGQRIEAAEASRYRRRLVFSIWVRIGEQAGGHADIGFELMSAHEPDAFDEQAHLEFSHRIERVPRGRWVHLEREIDARGFGANGLALELEFPAALLRASEDRIRLAGARLTDMAAAGRIVERLASVECGLAKRYFQRHDATTINSLGRALVVNAHELHFQFTFPEMRAFPAVTLPQENAGLRVFNLEGIPQEGFRYDVTYRSRGSAIIRATRENHGWRDGFLSFVGSGAAILLEAEL